MHGRDIPNPARRRTRRGVWCVLLAFLLTGMAAAQTPELIQPETPPEPPWQPPDITNLPVDWWTQFEVSSPDIRRTRLDRFLAAIEERLQGLDPESQVSARASLDKLRSLIELLEVELAGPPPVEFKAVPTLEAYTLEELLELAAQARDLEKQRAQTRLQIDQTTRQVALLQQRRDANLRDYEATSPESPRRILLGISRAQARAEYQMAVRQSENLTDLARRIGEQIELVRQQLQYARTHLVPGDASAEAAEEQAAAARDRLREANERIAALQRQLLEALSAEPLNESLVLLRQQQLTRASAEAELAGLKAALARARADWHLLRSGELDAGYDVREATAGFGRQTREALEQVDVWSTASQATLVAPAPGDSPNAQANFQIAQTVARETLQFLDQIRDASADLVLLENILSAETIDRRTGIARAWGRLTLATGAAWDRVQAILDINLFNIGDAPVTPGGIIKMLLVLALAYGISWFVRHLLGRLQGKRQFANSPAIYTLGRLTHYVVILVGVLLALGSIGIDFTNFALIAGALSVGIGFGLQAIVNNFVSGLILLFEGSLRVGDYVELDSGLAGVVREINTRATVVNTNDDLDVVVPNSELVTTKLTNWTLRDSVGRTRIPFGVAYGSDKEKVREAAMAAAAEMDFVLLNMPGREPQVRLVKFGDSALEFELLAWLSRQGVRRPHRVRSSFLWALETRLREAGIEIPFPQRDLHIRSGLHARGEEGAAAGAGPEEPAPVPEERA